MSALAQRLPELPPGATPSPRIAPWPPKRLSPPRDVTIDVARGLLMVLMISSHAISLTELPADSFFRSALWLPRGWTAQGFLMLTGLTAFMAFGPGRPRPLNGARVRALELLVLMIASNALFRTAQHLLEGGLTGLWSLEEWLQVLTFQKEITISAILLPTSLFLALVPELTWLRRRIGPEGFAAVAFGLFAAFNALASANWPALDANAITATLLRNGVGGFPVLPLLSNALAGLAAASLWECSRHRAPFTRPTSKAACVSVLALLIIVPEEAALVRAVVAPLMHFAVIFGFAAWLARDSAASGARVAPIRSIAQLLGRFPMFVFLGHRPVLQVLAMLTSGLAISPAPRYLVLTLTAVCAMAWLCAVRLRAERFNRAMRTLRL